MSPDDETELPPGPLLDAWEVPAPPSDLEDAIMKRIDMTTGSQSVDSGRATTLVVPLLAGLAAAALVLVWLATVRSGDTAPLVPAPVAAPPPVPGDARPVTAEPVAKATLVLRVGPDTAQVYVDGKPLAGPGPFIATDLDVGPHRIDLRAEGRVAVDRTLQLAPGTTEIPVVLAAKDVTLSVDTTPRNATLTLVVEVDGKTTRREVPHVVELSREPKARYSMTASAPGYSSRTIAIGFDGSAAQSVSFVLPRDPGTPKAKPKPSTPPPAAPFMPPRMGTLKVGTASGSPPAKVYVDGRYVGRTPQAHIKVTPGRHVVKWQWADGKTKSQSVVVDAGAIKIAKAG